jgi:hypothetical protein
MMRSTWLLAVFLAGSFGRAALAQESGGDPPAGTDGKVQNRLSAPIDFWGKGSSNEKPKSAPSGAEVGPGRIQIRETVWAQPVRTPDGAWMLYVPPKPILDFLENPTEETAKAYMAWKSDQAQKIGRAMLLLGRLKEKDATRELGKGDAGEASPEEPDGTAPTLIYFKKPTCPHCVSQDAVLAQWLPKHAGIRLGVVLPEERPELWKAYGVRGTPTLVLRSGTGKEEVLVGLKTEPELDAALKRIGAPSPEASRPLEKERSK